MSTEKKKCCQGCKNGTPGQNTSCQAKLIIEKRAMEMKIKNKDTQML